jgi:hypothetical protein
MFILKVFFMVTKVCSICGVEKLEYEFYQPKSKQCKPCVRASVKDLENRPDPVLSAGYKKKCRVCKQLLPSSAFHRRERSIDKLAYQCIECSQSDHQRYDTINKSAKINLPNDYMKKCPKCGRILPAKCFWTDMATLDHLKSSCIECDNSRTKSIRETDKYKEHRKKQSKRSREKNKQQERARSAVKRQIKKGVIPSPVNLVCIFSLTHTDVRPAAEYHHWKGYSKEHEKDVKPACISCHTVLSAWKRNIDNGRLRILISRHSR